MSKIIIKYEDLVPFPRLVLSIFGAPHRRQAKEDLNLFREELWIAWQKAGFTKPIDYPIDLWVCFIDPCSPDLDNLITALYRSMDGKTWKRPSIMVDDGLIQAVDMRKFYPNGPTKCENRVP